MYVDVALVFHVCDNWLESLRDSLRGDPILALLTCMNTRDGTHGGLTACVSDLFGLS